MSEEGNRYEAQRSLNQELTFEETEKEFVLRNIDFSSEQIRSLKLIDRNNLYTNLGQLLSDQCVHTVKAAVFQGDDMMIFRDRRELSGSLLKQMNDVYEFINFRNQIRVAFEGLVRIDVRDYPEAAIREALINLLVHRDYSYNAGSFIRIYENRIEFVNFGGLMDDVDVMAGVSACRNPDLADVFYRLGLIETYGTGISKIMKAYEGSETKPAIETTRNTFKLVLPNVRAE